MPTPTPGKSGRATTSLRPLSAHGLRQAEGLIAVFGNFAPPSRVLSSPYLRCMQTVDPLARPTTWTWKPKTTWPKARAPTPYAS